MVFPSGDQFEISAAGYRAVVTESGAALRVLEYDGRALVDGFGEDEMAPGGRGQLLMPWPNRIRDGRYEFGGRTLQLALTDPRNHNASHGLARWAAWTVEEHTTNSVSLVYRLMAQTGYPWAVDLHVLYDLSADGLHVTQTATNLSPAPAPYASGAHPYVCVGTGIDHLELTLPATVRVINDDRLLPVGQEDVAGTPLDFTEPRVIGDTVFNDGFGGLVRAEDGLATTVLRDPASGHGVALWVDARHAWLMVYSADDSGSPLARRSLAVEPMTAPADAFNSGRDLVTLAPGGDEGDELSVSGGIRGVTDTGD
jgi:aldose 1-epimerase